jgi:hypothetical protein
MKPSSGGPWTFEQLIKMPFMERFSEIMDVVRGHCRLAEYEARAPDQQRSRIETRISSALASTIALIAEVENKPSRKKRARRCKDRFRIYFIIRLHVSSTKAGQCTRLAVAPGYFDRPRGCVFLATCQIQLLAPAR